MNLKCIALHADEPTLRTLETYIGQLSFLTLCGAFHNPAEALSCYYEHKPDLCFVGIRPSNAEMTDGIEFSRMLDIPTRVIFLADNDDYVSMCFKLNALDYLTCPFSFPTFLQSVCKAVRQCSGKEKQTTNDATDMEQAKHTSICIRTDNRLLFLDFSEIFYVEGYGDYVKVYCNSIDKPYLTMCSMKYMEEKLPSNEFVRIHRSYIVHVRYIREIGQQIMITNGREIPVGDTYRSKLNICLQHRLTI